MEHENYCVYCMEALQANTAACPACGKSPADYVPQPHQLAPGTVLGGKYRLGRVLGEGGFGITYIGRDLNLDMPVAVKEYYPTGFVNRNTGSSAEVTANTGSAQAVFDKGKDRFMAEARTLAKFSMQPGIVGVRDFFVEHNTAYIIMDYLDGITLRDWLEQNGPVPFDRLVQLMDPVMDALARIHQAGLIHRDISPDNLMLMPDGSLKLLDFGAARNVSGVDEKSLSVMLKPGYAPEEQYRSKGQQGPWTDVYALCATLYRGATGQTPEDAMQRVFDDQLAPPSALGAQISPSQEAALMKGMAVLQKNRIASVEELRQALYTPPAQPAPKPAKSAVPVPFTPAPSGKAPANAAGNAATLPLADSTVMAASTGAPQTGGAPQPHDAQPYAAPAAAAPPVQPYQPMPSVGGASPVQPFTPAASGVGAPVQAGGQPTYAPATPLAPETDEFVQKRRRQKKRNKLMLFIGGGAAVLILVVAAVLLFTAGPLGRVQIGKYTFEKNATSVTSYDEITEKDIKQLLKLKDLKALTLYDNENMDTAKLQYLVDTLGNHGIERLYIQDAPNLTTITPLAGMKGLREINLTRTGVTDFSVLKDMPDLIQFWAQEMELTDISFLAEVTGLVELQLENNNIRDLTPLAKLVNLEYLYVTNNQITSFAGLEDMAAMTTLLASNNPLTDISAVRGMPKLLTLNIADSQISDISALANCPKLYTIKASNCQIKDISALAACTENLDDIDFSGNQLEDLTGLENNGRLYSVILNDNNISDISALAACKRRLKHLELNNNQLEDISVLYAHLNLTWVYMANNHITSLEGLSNCTLLNWIDFENNEISDVSMLSKSIATLTKVNFNQNNISDISALSGATLLEQAYFNHNNISDISGLSQSSSLKYLQLADNNISDLSPLTGFTELRSVTLADNQIVDISPLASMNPSEGFGAFAIHMDLSNNKITDISNLPLFTYSSLYLDGNPITDFSRLKELKVMSMSFTYSEAVDLESLKPAEGQRAWVYYVLDAPLDKQVAIEATLAPGYAGQVVFNTTEQVEENKRRELAGITGDEAEAEETGSATSEPAPAGSAPAESGEAEGAESEPAPASSEPAPAA